MKNRSILIIVLLLLTSTLMAQTRCYHGRSTYQSDILYTWDGQHVYQGRSTYQSDILYS